MRCLCGLSKDFGYCAAAPRGRRRGCRASRSRPWRCAWLRRGAGATGRGAPSKRTGKVGMRSSPRGYRMSWMIPHSVVLGLARASASRRRFPSSDDGCAVRDPAVSSLAAGTNKALKSHLRFSVTLQPIRVPSFPPRACGSWCRSAGGSAVPPAAGRCWRVLNICVEHREGGNPCRISAWRSATAPAA